MAQSTILVAILVATLLISILAYCSAENVYCVTPTITSCSSCPHNSANCTTLIQYAQEAKLYFTSNTTMVFLPRDHALDVNITVSHVAKLTMRGESSLDKKATVVCSGPVGLSFTSMVEFKIHSLAFTYCKRRYPISLFWTFVALHLQSTQYAELANCSFHDNLGTALVVKNTNIILSGNTDFTHNTPCGIVTRNDDIMTAGGIMALDSNLTFTGSTTFLDSNVSCSVPLYGLFGGGAIYTSGSTLLSFNGINNFINNSADYGGAICTSGNTVLNFSGTNNFINNSVKNGFGGAIYTSELYTSDNSVLSLSGINNFINNSADYGSGGAIYADANAVLSFSGTTNFINNWGYVGQGGGAIHTEGNNVLSFNGTNNFINNTADTHGGAIFAGNTMLNFSGRTNFINNSAEGSHGGGAIYADTNSTVTFIETIYFINNGYIGGGDTLDGYTNGGGVYLGFKSSFSILPHTTVYWENNHAMRGGAIYVADISPLSYCTVLAPQEECFFQLPGQNLSNGIDVRLVFKDNSAQIAGSVLFGGTIDNCKLTHGLDSYSSGKVFDMLVHNNDTDYNTTSNISSDPLLICQCENDHPDCSKTWFAFPRSVYPGEIFQIPVVVIGQRNGVIPSGVISTIDQTLSPGYLPHSQRLQDANNTCTLLSYTVLSLSQYVRIDLHADDTPCDFDNFILQIIVSLNQTCPPGFNISESAKSCICEPRLAQYTHQCSITNGVRQITRDSGKQFWI